MTGKLYFPTSQPIPLAVQLYPFPTAIEFYLFTLAQLFLCFLQHCIWYWCMVQQLGKNSL